MFKLRECIKSVDPYAPGKPIKEVERELGIKDPIKLASNENAWGFSPKAMKAMEEAIREAYIYPDGNSFYLRQKIAEFNNVSADNVMVGNGSNEAFEVIMRVVLEPGRNVVSSQYAFALYKIVALTAGAKYIATPAKEYRYNYKAIINACDDNTAMIIIDNPNNPTGTYIPFNEMLELMEFAEKKGILLIADEAYIEYVRAKDFKSMMSVWGKYKNLVITRTFSKAYGLCGLRVGYVMADKEVIKYANMVREPFNVNLVAQYAATAALDDQDFINNTVKRTHEGIDYLIGELNTLGMKYLPTQCNFILVEVPEESKTFFEKLLRLGIIVRPMHGYGLPKFIRLSVGTMEQNKKAIAAIRSLIK